MADVATLVDQVSKLGDEEFSLFMVDVIGKQSVLRVAGTVKAMEQKFGVSAAAPVAMAAGAGPSAGTAAAVEEKTAFDVVLKAVGPNKIQVIKAVRSFTNLGLKEAKDLVEAAPKTVKEGATKEEAEKIKKELEAAGGTVEIK